MDKILIEMDMETGDFTVDYTNDGKGCGIDEALFAIVGLTKSVKENFDIPVVNVIGLICEQEALWDNPSQYKEEKDVLN